MEKEIFIHDSSIPDYDDLEWDTMSQTKREELALQQAKTAALFSKMHVPFYRDHFKKISEKEIESFKSLEEFALKLPETTKEHLTITHPSKFLPDLKISTEYINKGTGGSTGKPVSIFYSVYDWEAMAQNIARSIKFDFRDDLPKLKGLKICGLYHGDHVTNGIYRKGLHKLGISLYGRPSTKKRADHVYDFIQDVQPNGILAPPEDMLKKTTKGITMDKVLVLDAKNESAEAYRFNNDKNKEFCMVLWSSLPLSKDLYSYLKDHLKIPYIQGQYGSTECAPTGATCSHKPFSFHLGYGPNVVNVVLPSKKGLAKNGQEGYLLVTKTAGVVDDQKIVPTGTNLINFRTGDFAIVENYGKKCGCGRTTPIISDLKRREAVEIKAEFGCEID